MDNSHKVSVENINMPFWSLVGFLVKVSLAVIPALFILAIVMVLILGLLFGFASILSGILKGINDFGSLGGY